MITICLTYFKSLALANLNAALYSVRQQDLSHVDSMVIVDNDTADSLGSIHEVVDSLSFPVPVQVLSVKHGDPLKTHSWSTNMAVREARTPWILFTRADYLLDFNLIRQFQEVVLAHSRNWNGFVTGNVYHLMVDIGACEQLEWRHRGPQTLRMLPGAVADYTRIDTGVWMGTKQAFDQVQGLDEALTAWGHAQTHFQFKLHSKGTDFVRIPSVMFYHPQHSAPRDLELAHRQLREHGVDLKELWSRHDGEQPYR